ncbi:hypothetical protein TNCV_2020291 [Trichonephila clavipes]|nr:hypothetical protein TNCV_2020291 [Trichonephila clavipes]
MQNRKKLSVVGEKCRDLHAWKEEEALCKAVERALLVKLFYENKGNAFTVVREIRRRKNLLRGSRAAFRLRYVPRAQKIGGRKEKKLKLQ